MFLANPAWATLTQSLHSHLQPLLKNVQNNTDIASLIAEDAAAQWRQFLHGLWLYQHHPLQRVDSNWDVITQIDAVALKRLASPKATKNKPAVLLVPSLINRFHILDLHPEHSFAQFLQQQGYDVYLIDWHHDPALRLPESLTDCVQNYLLPLQAHMPKTHHLIGYCMGGTLSLAAAIINPKPVRSLTLMATPWDFHQPSREAALQFAALLHGFGNSTAESHITSEWLQMLFWQRDPLAALRKFQNFVRVANTPSSTHFVLAEDWLNSGIDLPTSFLHDCAHQWFGENKPLAQTWSVGEHLVDLKKLKKIPIHLVSAERDKLVPPASSLAIEKIAPHATHSLFDTGHIGLFAGGKSKTDVWPHVQQFLTDHNP